MVNSVCSRYSGTEWG